MTTTHVGAKVLVPLDGSHDVRAALGPAAEIAAASSGELVLLVVVTSEFEKMVAEFSRTEHSTAEQAASTYLYQVEDGLCGELDDVVISRVIRTGDDPTGEILRVAKDIDATMIALTSHGYTGFKKLLLGSVAQAILHRSKIPVLLVPSVPEL
jgi:nucleotide-binding universal stress UspA family protein